MTKHFNRSLFCLLAVMSLASMTETAFAANRTVCFTLGMLDAVRTNCPGAGGGVNSSGAKRQCRADNVATNVDYMVGAEVLLFDKDYVAGDPDDFIGLWVTAGPGLNCITFPWEGQSYTGGEANPDLYLEINNIYTAGDNLATVEPVDANDNSYSHVSWRGSNSDDTFVALNCTAGTQCQMGTLKPFTSTSSNAAQALLLADSAQRMIEVYWSQMNSGRTYIEFPTSDPNCTTGCANSRTSIGIPTGLAVDGGRITHEMGHVLQMQLFEQDGLTGDPACTFNGNGWSPGGFEWQSCASYEGWASYVAGVSWWLPGSVAARPSYLGFDFENPTPTDPTCTNNIWIPGQVAKAFWDLDDANNEAGVVDGDGNGSIDNDAANLDTLDISHGMDSFPDGTANHQDRENNLNAVNERDYDAVFNVNNQTFLYHNCLTAQDP